MRPAGELVRLLEDADAHVTMLRALVLDEEWLFAALTIVGLEDVLDEVRSAVEDILDG